MSVSGENILEMNSYTTQKTVLGALSLYAPDWAQHVSGLCDEIREVTNYSQALPAHQFGPTCERLAVRMRHTTQSL